MEIKRWKPSYKPPTESDRYWCYVESLGCLSISHYQQNIYYSAEENRWSTDDGDIVTHWTELMKPPRD